MNNKSIYALLILVALVAAGGYFFPKSTIVRLSGAISPTGSTNNVTSWSSINFTPTTANGTSTSILNTGNDRAIMGSYVACTGLGTSQAYNSGTGLTSNGWTLLGATTSVSSTGLQGNTNYILNTFIATTTVNYYVGSTTEGVIAYTSRIWPANTYLTFNFNATNTAQCSIGVEFVPL